MIDASPDANGVSCARKVILPQRSTDSAEKAVAQYPFLDGDDDSISQFVDDLAVAYAAAREIGDDVGLETYGKALKAIGRYLAFEIGPKAAGIKLS